VSQHDDEGRSIGLLGATGVGVGAIVGGGILVLAGTAFASTGPSAIVAIAINGVIALLTAASLAEMSTAFPQSGGLYTFAKKVTSVRSAFAVGWVLWFAYIVAGVLYALGFAAYGAAMVLEVWRAIGEPPTWLSGRTAMLALATLAVFGYAVELIRKGASGGSLAIVGKVVVFVILILVGLVVLVFSEPGTVRRTMTPFFPEGGTGLMQAMGFTFIALQGFDLIAAVGGEVRKPARNIPRAMFLSLGAAIAIYLPLLFVVATVGSDGGSIQQMSMDEPDTVFAVAVRNYMGPWGYWFVMVAAVLSTLSALNANLLAASQISFSMARDRTLPAVLEGTHAARKTPVMAIYASALAMFAILLMVPDLASAGAAASLIFLVSFALSHGMSILARLRSSEEPPFRTPWFPLVPAVGGLACVAMALFQGVAVPTAGAIAMMWLGLGVLLYFSVFSSRARVVDAFAEANDPRLSQLRGRNPLVLVPIANPKGAPAMVAMGHALSAPNVGRVLLLTVVRVPQEAHPEQVPASVTAAQQVLQGALTTALTRGYQPEVLMTVSSTPWSEIVRVARAHRCESLLVGLSNLESGPALENLLNEIDCDVTVLRAPSEWTMGGVRRVLVPVSRRMEGDRLRARMLGSLARNHEIEVTYLCVVPPEIHDEDVRGIRETLVRLAADETPGGAQVEVVRGEDVLEVVGERSQGCDIVVVKLHRHRGRRLFGEVALQIAHRVPCAVAMISRRD
jgi:basic amino acid/polyamine antiporter, APA family